MGSLPALMQHSGQKALRGPCLKCGGTRRMVVFLNGKFPKWYLRCDLCGFEGYVPKVVPGIAWPEGYIEPIQPPDARDYSEVIKTLNEKKIDQIFHNNLDIESRAEWRRMGIPDSMQDFFRLGFVKGRPFKKTDESGMMVLDAHCIPKYGLGWDLRNMDFRMVNPPKEEGRYRPFPGAPPTPFLSRPDMKTAVNEDGRAYIFEGSKKAAVASIFLDKKQTIGIPSSNSWAKATELVKEAEIVYIILDPDSWVWARKLSKEIGSTARQVTLPGKFDDAVIEGSLGMAAFNRAIKFARREVV